jgi:hypothetical protein
MAISKNELNEQVLRKAREDSSFLAHAFALFLQCRGESEEQLATALSCSLDVLHRLELCRRPMSTDTNFRHDIETIARFGGIEPTRLVQVLRTVESIDAFRGTTLHASEPALLRLAARESGKRKPSDEGKTEDGKES